MTRGVDAGEREERRKEKEKKEREGGAGGGGGQITFVTRVIDAGEYNAAVMERPGDCPLLAAGNDEIHG